MVGIKILCFKIISLSWTDIDECTQGLNNCSLNSTCSNTVGSYQCFCFTGYEDEGMGYVCKGKYFDGNIYSLYKAM